MTEPEGYEGQLLLEARNFFEDSGRSDLNIFINAFPNLLAIDDLDKLKVDSLVRETSILQTKDRRTLKVVRTLPLIMVLGRIRDSINTMLAFSNESPIQDGSISRHLFIGSFKRKLDSILARGVHFDNEKEITYEVYDNGAGEKLDLESFRLEDINPVGDNNSTLVSIEPLDSD